MARGQSKDVLIATDRNAKERLEGAQIIAQDGTFLGVITEDAYQQQSIFYKYGPYGSEDRMASIWNKYSTYGAKTSDLSPFSKRATKPPRVMKNGDCIGYLTISPTCTQRIHPRVLVLFLTEKSKAIYRTRINEAD